MSFNREKYEYFFPSKVYRCACLGGIVQNTYDHGHYSLHEIVNDMTEHSFFDEKKKVFSAKFGAENKECIFVCETHLCVVLLAKKEFACTDVEGPENITAVYSNGKKETFCKGCIKHDLKIMYYYFVFVDFNLKCS